MKKQQPSRGRNRVILFLIVTYLLGSGYLFAAELNDYETIPYDIYTLKHISAEQGKNYLNQAKIGTVSSIPGTSALLITARRQELLKAKTVLNLVDQQELFVVQSLPFESEAANLPSNEQLMSRLGDITIGDFSHPPAAQMGTRAIVDIHNDSVLVIAPLEASQRIISTILQPVNGDYSILNTPSFVKSIIPATSQTAQTISEPQNFTAALYEQLSNQRITENNTAEQITQQTTPQQMTQELFASIEPAEAEQVPIPNGDDVVRLTLPEKLTLVQFLGMVGPYLQMDFMYDPAQLVGEITFTFSPNGVLQGPITIRDLYALLEVVLKFKGFVMTRGRGNIVIIVPEENALSIDPALVSADRPQVEAGDIVVMSVFELKHISTSSAQDFLERMNLATDITSIAETQTIIVTAYAHRMPRIRMLLDLVDSPGRSRFRFRQLRYTMAQTLAPKLQSLAEKVSTVSVTIGAAPEEELDTTRPLQQPGETVQAFTIRLQRWQAQMTAAATASARSDQEATATGPTVYLDADERTNRILMIGRQEQLDEIEQLIDTLDVAQQDLRTLEIYQIEHIDATDIKNKLIELGIIMADTEPSATARVTGDAAQQPVAPTIRIVNNQPAETLAGEPQVVVVEPTNSLLVRATIEQHQQIAEVISHVDNPAETIPYQVYQLRNQGPEGIRDLLLELVRETIVDPEGRIETVNRLEDPIWIVSDSNTSSLIVYANKKNQDWIGELIESLDKRRPQVLIDVTLVQISKTDAFNYDLNLLSSFPDLTSTSGLTGALLPGVEAGTSNLVSPLLESERDRFVDFQSRSGTGTGFYGDRHINALLTAMQQKDYGRVLDRPKILVNDNEDALIRTTDITYVTKQTGTIIEGVANAVQTAIDYEGYDAGITLNITPHISESNLLRLDIDLTRKNFGTITGEKPPDTTDSTVSTTVTVPDGSTIILGGLLKLNQSKGGTKVPILGDLPLVGGAFRSTSNSDLQRNLYVFVKAEIIRPPDEDDTAVTDLQRISDRNRAAFELHEDEFQKYQSWPGITDKQVQPFKVLDAQ